MCDVPNVFLSRALHCAQLDTASAIGTSSAVMNGIVCIHYTDNMNTYFALKDTVLTECTTVSQLKAFKKFFTEQWVEMALASFYTLLGYATTNNPCRPSAPF